MSSLRPRGERSSFLPANVFLVAAVCWPLMFPFVRVAALLLPPSIKISTEYEAERAYSDEAIPPSSPFPRVATSMLLTRASFVVM